MPQYAKVLAAKTVNLNWLLGPKCGKRKWISPTCSLPLHEFYGLHIYVRTDKQIINAFLKVFRELLMVERQRFREWNLLNAVYLGNLC